MYELGWKQFIPFTVTVLGIVFIDLLWGIGLGLARWNNGYSYIKVIKILTFYILKIKVMESTK